MKTVLLFALLFVFLGVVLLPYNGLESDEVIFAQPLHGLINPTFSIRVHHHGKNIVDNSTQIRHT